MPNRVYRVRVTFPKTSGLPRDAIINTWAYQNSESSDRVADAADFQAQLETFYEAWVPTMGHSLYSFGSPVLEHYDYSDPVPRLPFVTSTPSWSSPPTTSFDWPSQIAVVLSMEGMKVSGANMRRRRGRVYCGPLQFGAADNPLLTNAHVDLVANSADTAFFSGTHTTALQVYSPYTHRGIPVGQRLTYSGTPPVANYPELPANLIDAFEGVVRIWCDNRFDVQRRRGVTPSYRKTVNI